MIEQSTYQKSKKTRKKLITQLINRPLFLLDSPAKKYYERAFHCSSILQQEGTSLKSHYCNSRTCITCNGKRTAAYIKHYGSQVLALNDAQFVTLTAKTVECHDSDTLRYFIDQRESVWRKIYKNANKCNRKLVGMKSMEITARPDNHYHIHFHFIIEGKENAEWVKSQWLKHYTNAEHYLQKIKPIKDENSLLEVFKYGTKFADKEKVKVKGKIVERWKRVAPERTDLIIRALMKKRLISLFGGIRKIETEDVNEMDNDQIIDMEDKVCESWIWNNIDWFCASTGEKFSNYILSEELKRVFDIGYSPP
jgi:hypothetical protein